MSVGESGRIVIEVPTSIKRLLYSDLSKSGISLKAWFLNQAELYLNEKRLDKQERICMGLPALSSMVIGTDLQENDLETAEKTGPSITADSSKDEKIASTSSFPIKQALINKYNEMESRFPIRVISENVSYVSPVNFVESLSCARHRWFPYKEGFSPTFVKSFLSEFQLTNSDLVVDPFSGVGTTALVASIHGHSAVGLDVSPMAHFIAETKATNLDSKQLREFDTYIKYVEAAEDVIPAIPPDNATVKSYFTADFLDSLMRIKTLVKHTGTVQVHDLAKLAFLTLVETFSTHRKAGNGVKRKTKISYGKPDATAFDEIRFDFVQKLKEMRTDLESTRLIKNPDFRLKSCLDNSSLEGVEGIGTVLTSPPYANCFDYSKIYQRELWLGDFFLSSEDNKHFRERSVRSHVHATWKERHASHANDIVDELICSHLKEQVLWSKKIPDMLSGYFKDIGAVLNNLHPRMKRGASFGLVVGNSVYGGIPIATDLLIGQIAVDLGFKLERIDVYRSVIPSSQQFMQMEEKRWARESMVIVKKK